MLRVVLPVAFAVTRHVLLVIAAIDIVIDVGVAIDVDIDISTAPVVIAPGITPSGAHGDARAEGKH
ncbi:MAG: hypothetical protein ACREMY_12600, partial [bacterium]